MDLPWNATAERVRKALVDIGIRASGVVREALDPHRGRVGYRWRIYYADAGERSLLSCAETLRGAGRRCMVQELVKGVGPDVVVRVSHNGRDFVAPRPALGDPVNVTCPLFPEYLACDCASDCVTPPSRTFIVNGTVHEVNPETHPAGEGFADLEREIRLGGRCGCVAAQRCCDDYRASVVKPLSFRYHAPIVVEKVTPGHGPAAGGTEVTLRVATMPPAAGP